MDGVSPDGAQAAHEEGMQRPRRTLPYGEAGFCTPTACSTLSKKTKPQRVPVHPCAG